MKNEKIMNFLKSSENNVEIFSRDELRNFVAHCFEQNAKKIAKGLFVESSKTDVEEGSEIRYIKRDRISSRWFSMKYVTVENIKIVTEHLKDGERMAMVDVANRIFEYVVPAAQRCATDHTITSLCKILKCRMNSIIIEINDRDRKRSMSPEAVYIKKHLQYYIGRQVFVK